jgi:hypothetical protein
MSETLEVNTNDEYTFFDRNTLEYWEWCPAKTIERWETSKIPIEKRDELFEVYYAFSLLSYDRVDEALPILKSWKRVTI